MLAFEAGSTTTPPTTPRRVLVTGAGSGIGAALAHAFAAQGDEVIGTVRDAERAAELGRRLRRDGRRMSFRALELQDEAAITRLVGAIEADGGLDVLVNNAGTGVFGAAEDVDATLARSQFEVNLLGPLALTRALLPSLRRCNGRILWIGSLAGRFALPFQAHYSASKAAVAALSDAMRMELRPFGVQVACVEPADFRTEFTAQRRFALQPASPYRELARRCLDAVVASELEAPTPERMAHAVASWSRRSNLPARLPVGRFARLLCLARWLLPQPIVERLLRATYRV